MHVLERVLEPGGDAVAGGDCVDVSKRGPAEDTDVDARKRAAIAACLRS